jgi:hypothetical protein
VEGACADAPARVGLAEFVVEVVGFVFVGSVGLPVGIVTGFVVGSVAGLVAELPMELVTGFVVGVFGPTRPFGRLRAVETVEVIAWAAGQRPTCPQFRSLITSTVVDVSSTTSIRRK